MKYFLWLLFSFCPLSSCSSLVEPQQDRLQALAEPFVRLSNISKEDNLYYISGESSDNKSISSFMRELENDANFESPFLISIDADQSKKYFEMSVVESVEKPVEPEYPLAAETRSLTYELIDRDEKPLADIDFECVFLKTQKIFAGKTDANGVVTLHIPINLKKGLCSYQYEGRIIAEPVLLGDNLIEKIIEDQRNSEQKSIDHYLVYGNKVFDKRTKLEWARCSIGQIWEDDTCTGTPSRFNWYTARNFQRDGWRLPTKEEMTTLIECGTDKQKTALEDEYDSYCLADHNIPTIHQSVFPNTPSTLYWTATETRTLCCAWWLDFRGGGFGTDGGKNIAMSVRLVRDGPDSL